jgi:hypothetical protein
VAPLVTSRVHCISRERLLCVCVSAAAAAAMMMLIHSKDIWPLDWPLCGVSIEIMLSVMPLLLRADHMIVWNYCRLLLGSIIILFENSNNKGSSV